MPNTSEGICDLL